MLLGHLLNGLSDQSFQFLLGKSTINCLWNTPLLRSGLLTTGCLEDAPGAHKAILTLVVLLSPTALFGPERQSGRELPRDGYGFLKQIPVPGVGVDPLRLK